MAWIIAQCDVLVPQALEDLVDAVGEVKALQERHAEADRNAPIEVSAQVHSSHIGTYGLLPDAEHCIVPDCCICHCVNHIELLPGTDEQGLLFALAVPTTFVILSCVAPVFS